MPSRFERAIDASIGRPDCGSQSRVWVSSRDRHAATAASRPTPEKGIGIVSAHSRAPVSTMLNRLSIRFQLYESFGPFMAHIESGCPAWILVDSDVLGDLSDLCKLARSIRPDVAVIGLTTCWSDHDAVLWGCVDAVLHKPPREEAWRSVFSRFGLP